MATHEQNIENLRTAIYGEQVRGSMIELFNESFENAGKMIQIGTTISSTTSSSAGFDIGNIYINDSTWDVWKCVGVNSWALQGNIKGAADVGFKSASAYDFNIDNSNKVLKINKNNYLFFGDSFLDENTNFFTFPNRTDILPEHSWGFHLDKLLKNDTTYNFGVAGAGYTRTGNLKLENKLDEAIADSRFANQDITHIIVGAGVNDASDIIENNSTTAGSMLPVGDLTRAVESFCNKCLANFPNAKVYVFTNWSATYITKKVLRCYNAINDAVVNVGDNRLAFMPDIECKLLSFTNTILSGDGTHPNEKGGQILATAIYNSLNGYNTDVLGRYKKYELKDTEGKVGATITMKRYGHTLSLLIKLFKGAKFAAVVPTPWGSANGAIVGLMGDEGNHTIAEVELKYSNDYALGTLQVTGNVFQFWFLPTTVADGITEDVTVEWTLADVRGCYSEY